MEKGRSKVATPKREEPPPGSRWSARKKADAVVRLLRGESLDELSRELRVEAHRLQAWRDEFLAGGIEGLKARPLQPEDRRLRDADGKIGELMMTTISCGRRPKKGTSVCHVSAESERSRSETRTLNTASEIRRLRQRRASLSDLPSASLRW